MKRIYLAGPMGGLPQFNFPTFDAGVKYLRALGWDVVNPADLDRAAGIDLDRADWTVTEAERQDALARDFRELVTCDAIGLLPGWQRSRGALAERRVAEDIGLEVYHVVPFETCAREVPAVLVGLSGYAQAGKDTVGSLMGAAGGFTRLAFADALKDVARQSNPWVTGDGYFNRLGPLVAHYGGWEMTKREWPDSRVYLQHLGQAVREHLGESTWIDACLAEAVPGGRFVITDVRYPNEAAAIKAAGGYVVRVERPGTGPANAHVSESALDGYEFDAIIRNTGDLDRLRKLVRIFLTSLETIA